MGVAGKEVGWACVRVGSGGGAGRSEGNAVGRGRGRHSRFLTVECITVMKNMHALLLERRGRGR